MQRGHGSFHAARFVAVHIEAEPDDSGGFAFHIAICKPGQSEVVQPDGLKAIQIRGRGNHSIQEWTPLVRAAVLNELNTVAGGGDMLEVIHDLVVE